MIFKLAIRRIFPPSTETIPVEASTDEDEVRCVKFDMPGPAGPKVTFPPEEVCLVLTVSRTSMIPDETVGGIESKISRLGITCPPKISVGLTGTKTRTRREPAAGTRFFSTIPFTFGTVAAETDVTRRTVGAAKLMLANAIKARRPS